MLQSNNCQTACGGTPAQLAPVSLIQLSTALQDHLMYADNAQQARGILRSWFLAQVLQGDASDQRTNPGDLAENVYLYEMLDEFLSAVVYNFVPAQV